MLFSGRGRLYSFTRVVQPPRGFATVAPYAVGMVRLDEGPMVTAQLTDVEGLELSLDMEVEMCTRKIRDASENGFIVYGYKFRPLLRPSGRTTASDATSTPAATRARGRAPVTS